MLATAMNSGFARWLAVLVPILACRGQSVARVVEEVPEVARDGLGPLVAGNSGPVGAAGPDPAAGPDIPATSPPTLAAVAVPRASLREPPAADPRDCGFQDGGAPPNARVHALAVPSLGNLCYTVVLPEDPAALATPRPLLVFLHGLGAEPASLLRGSGFARAVARARAAGDWPDPIIVLPTGREGYWTDHPDGAHPWGSSVLAVVDAVRASYPVIPDAAHTAIAGISMGGFGALSLGLRYPDRFGVMVGISATDLARAVAEQPRRKIYTAVVGEPADPAKLAAIQPIALVRAGAGANQRIVLVWGDHEPARYSAGSRELAAALRARQAEVTVRVVRGGTHAWDTTWTTDTMVWWMQAVGSAIGRP